MASTYCAAMWFRGRKEVYITSHQLAHISVVMIQANSNTDSFALERARVVTNHRSLRIALFLTKPSRSNRRSTRVDQRGAASRLHFLCHFNNCFIADILPQLEPLIPSIQGYSVPRHLGRHSIFRPINDDRLQIGKLIANRENLLSLLTTLANAHNRL